MRYDYLIVGAGLAGSMMAYRAKKAGKSVLVIDKRGHTGGNLYCKETEGIHVHQYGPHIFHTSNKMVWDFVNSLVPFHQTCFCPLAYSHGRLFHLPFNMNTFYELWGTKTPVEAKKIIDIQRQEIQTPPCNLEEQAIALVGREIYERFIKGYTEKQWGHRSKDLPAFIIRRLPVRYYYDNNYYNDTYQGIPIGGYNRLTDKLLSGIEIHLATDYLDNREKWNAIADKIIYTGPIDAFFNFKYGDLEYRSLRFEEELIEQESYQGTAVVNYVDADVAYTRIVEHKYFEMGSQPKTVITREYPMAWERGLEPYYPVNDDANNRKYAMYKDEAKEQNRVTFFGRLAEYKYYDMDQIVERALALKL